MHLARYGTSAPAEPAAIVSLHTTVTVTGKRPVYFHGRGFLETRTFARAALRAGNRIAGPALIEEHASTTVLMGGDRLEVDPYGNLAIAVGKAER